MKKISDSTLEQLRGISPDELIVHGVIQPAPNHKGKNGYICPLCGSGTGRNHNGRGDGAGTFDNRNRFYCHSCGNAENGGHKLSPIDLFAIANNLQNQPFSEQCRQMGKEFGLPVDCDDVDFDYAPSRRQRSKAMEKFKPNFEKIPIGDDELDLIREDLAVSDESLIDYLHMHGGSWRGLPLDILQKHGCKFIADWKSPKSRIEKKFSTPTPRMLIPAGDSYLARLANNLDFYDEQTRKYIKPKPHAGKKELFNPDALNSDEPVFCVEGYVDCMSIELAGFNAVALGGANRGDLIATAIAKKEKKPQIIILLDADDTGRQAVPELRDWLFYIGCPCVVRFLTADNSKLDANEILTTKGKDALQDRLQEIVDDSRAELDAVATELEKEKNSSLSDELLDFLFDGNSSDLTFAGRLERFCGHSVRWLTDSERWLIYGGGVWTRTSEKNSAISPFARELADLMRQHAENKDEGKLADAFQSAKKIGNAIGLLKSHESVRITADDLDRHSELLNVLNGVVDLQTGKLLDADPSLLITRQCRADYQADAHSELVNKFFRDIMPDEQTRAGLLRWLGYCLTGETREEKFMVWHGGGANGKGILGTAVLGLLGTYATGLAPRALLKTNRTVDADKATTALNALEGVRFAISEELPADAEIDCSLIKNLTGGDRINLRKNYGEYRTITNFAKINISGNYLPRIENIRDGGILRRLLNMPFAVKFGTPDNPADSTLKNKMLQQESLRGLLALLVRQAALWYRDGLIISPQMEKETKTHLEQNDFVSDFIADFYVRVPNAYVKAKDFIDALKAEYPRECSRFKRADLVKLIANTSGITYALDRTKTRVFKGIGKLGAPKQQDMDFDGEPVNQNDALPFDPNDTPFD